MDKNAPIAIWQTENGFILEPRALDPCIATQTILTDRYVFQTLEELFIFQYGHFTHRSTHVAVDSSATQDQCLNDNTI